jgi:GntR family transcriptional regulator, transcriptional repressor for pyruvate dehydrogenase complex
MTTKAAFAIAAEFRARIAKGELRAGDPLPVESELMDELGVSKGVVRETLRILETEGLVEVRRGLGGGPRVRHPSISEASKGVGIYLQIGDVLVMDVWEARDRIIANAVDRLGSVRTEGDAVALQTSLEELAATVGDFDAFYGQLLDMGETAVRMAGNRTDYVLVVALRHIISAELEAATRAVVDVGQAVAAEQRLVGAWREISRHVKTGRGGAARRIYEEEAGHVRNGLAEMMQGTTVVDIFSDSDS